MTSRSPYRGALTDLRSQEGPRMLTNSSAASRHAPTKPRPARADAIGINVLTRPKPCMTTGNDTPLVLGERTTRTAVRHGDDR